MRPFIIEINRSRTHIPQTSTQIDQVFIGDIIDVLSSTVDYLESQLRSRQQRQMNAECDLLTVNDRNDPAEITLLCVIPLHSNALATNYLLTCQTNIPQPLIKLNSIELNKRTILSNFTAAPWSEAAPVSLRRTELAYEDPKWGTEVSGLNGREKSGRTKSHFR